jgi:hypothetical protein
VNHVCPFEFFPSALASGLHVFEGFLYIASCHPVQIARRHQILDLQRGFYPPPALGFVSALLPLVNRESAIPYHSSTYTLFSFDH